MHYTACLYHFVPAGDTAHVYIWPSRESEGDISLYTIIRVLLFLAVGGYLFTCRPEFQSRHSPLEADLWPVMRLMGSVRDSDRGPLDITCCSWTTLPVSAMELVTAARYNMFLYDIFFSYVFAAYIISTYTYRRQSLIFWIDRKSLLHNLMMVSTRQGNLFKDCFALKMNIIDRIHYWQYFQYIMFF